MSITMRLVEPAIILTPDRRPPAVVRDVTLSGLCDAAGIDCRVTIGRPPRIVLHRGQDHRRSVAGIYYVGIGRRRLRSRMTRVQALRILEVLAYGFFDYGARECVCGRGLFVG